MTVSNHALAGALIAVTLQNPVYVLPLAFLSHFLLDALPHYGVDDPSASAKDKYDRHLKFEVLGLLGIAALLSTGLYGWNLVLLASLVAALPDLEWPLRYLLFARRGKKPPRSWTAAAHKKIQWCEKPWGYLVEILFFIVGYTVLLVIT